jgi:dipeptidase
MDLLQENKGKIDLRIMKDILRSHTLNPQRTFPDRSLTAWNVCMHAGPGPIRNSQTTGSLITQFENGEITHWVTGTAAPCLSVFKPVWMHSGISEIGLEPAQYFDEKSLWWQHELLHRRILKDFHARQPVLASQIEALEDEIDAMIALEKTADVQAHKKISTKSFQMEKEQFNAWYSMIENVKSNYKNAAYYEKYWQKNNQKARIPV